MSVSHYSAVTVLHAWTCLRSCQCEVWAAAGWGHETKIRLTPLVDMDCMSLAGTVCVWVCVRGDNIPPGHSPCYGDRHGISTEMPPESGAGGVMGNIVKQYGYLCNRTNQLFCSIPWLWGILTQLHKMSRHGEYDDKKFLGKSINVC